MTDRIQVNSPPHYRGTKYEVIEVIHGLGLTTDYAFGNAIKYLLRYHKKGAPTIDVMKAGWYINWLLDHFTCRPPGDPKFPESVHAIVQTFELPDELIRRAVYNVMLSAWVGMPAPLYEAKTAINAWLDFHNEPGI